MEIIGKLIKRLDPVKGTSKAGKEWQKQSFIFDIKLKLFKDLKIGEQYKVYINISSKEFNGKYYSSINGWNINPIQENKETDLPF